MTGNERLTGIPTGFTLTEVLIAAALIGIGVLGTISAFHYIQRAIQGSKAHSLASNLAQEKMQIVMQKSYYEILVTTFPASETRVSPNLPYDNTYFTPEAILEGSINFRRLTYVESVIENSGQIEAVLGNDAADTGMRRITVSILWQSGAMGDAWNVLSLQNIINNPSTVMNNALVTGTVSNTQGGALTSALVTVAENIGWRDSTDSTGKYSIHVSSGVYDLIASAQGYYPKRTSFAVAPGGTAVSSFTLTAIATGTVQGTAWMNNHVVISQVVASSISAVDGRNYEYVELFNPTADTITVHTNDFRFCFSDDACSVTYLYPTVVTTSWPPYAYYLVANYSDHVIIGGVSRNVDAYYPTSGSHLLNAGQAGGLHMHWTPFTLTNGLADVVSWKDGATTFTCSQYYETQAALANGLAVGEQLVRRESTMTYTNIYGNAYDSNNNSIDLMDYTTLAIYPNNSGIRKTPIAGTPAGGAIISVGDTTSAPSTATITSFGGNPPYAFFTIPGVATGTWSVSVDSYTYSAQIDTVTVVALSTTNIPNAGTVPPWPAAGRFSVVLSTYGLYGVVSGTVLDINGFPIISGPTINVSVGGFTKAVNGSGYYSIRVPTGTYDVTANPTGGNSLYETETQQAVTITLGDTTARKDFRLSQGGRITGWITRDGVNPLPGIAVTAADGNGAVQDTQVSGSNGRFTLVNLSTGTYTIEPVLDPKETASPVNVGTTIVAAGSTVWSTTFTVLGAMGTVVGSVSASGLPIKTGVLIVVSTAAVGAGGVPPSISSNSLTSAAFYAASSREDGTYSIDVRGSTTSVYNVYAYYQRLSGSTVVISSSTRPNVTVTAGQTTSPAVNFTW